MTLSGVEFCPADVDPVGSLICRVQASCEEHLVGGKERWTEFISVNCLRNHAVFGQVPVMNQIYVVCGAL